MIQVDPFNDIPVYQQIVEQVRLGVARGQFKPGDKLEPVRQLAERVAVNPSTVARAYQLLEHDGIIETNRRRGSVVARSADADAVRSLRENRLRSIVERPLVEALAQGYSPEEVAAAFELQMAVWRERRQPAPAPVATAMSRGGGQPPPHPRGRPGAGLRPAPTTAACALPAATTWPSRRCGAKSGRRTPS